jgi:hypothetical protein
LKSFRKRFCHFRNNIYLCAPLVCTIEYSDQFLKKFLEVFRKRFGGLKNSFYLCSPKPLKRGRVMKDPRGLLKEKFFEVIKQLKFILTRFERNGNNFQNTFEYSQDI